MATGTSAQARLREPRPAPRSPDGAVQRYPADLVRVFLGVAVLGIGFLLAQRGELSLFELNVFRLFNGLPGIFYPVVWAVMQLGNVVAVPVVAAAAALTRRWRMARDLLASGLLAYLTADLVKGVVGRERPAGFPVDAALRDGTVSGIGFISGHSAVAAALAAAAAPYLSRRARRVAWALAWSVALARVYVGAHLPLDVVGGVATGWAIGALVHWIFGVPRWHPDRTRVGAMLRSFGLPVHDLRESAVTARSSHPFEGVDGTGRRVYVKVLDPDRFERDWLYRLYRLVAVRDIKDADAVAPLGQQAEHEAVAAMTARERGVRVPPVLLARGTDRGAVVVQEYLVGRPLDDLSQEELTPALLAETWRQVGLLRRARIAHHDLVTSSVLVDGAGRPWIVDFGNAETGADDDDLAGDVAELMASLSLRLDVGTVADSAVRALGRPAVEEALPRLAPLGLSLATRRGVRDTGLRLGELRRAVRARLELPDPDRPEAAPAGLLPRLLVTSGAVLIVVGVPLLAGATAVVESVEVGGWRWLGGALALAVLARAALAMAATATVERRLAPGRTFGASMVADGASLLYGRAGWRRAAARFLERAGVTPGPAVRAVDRFAAASVVAAVVVALGTLVLAGVEGALTTWHTPDAILSSVLLGLVAWALVLGGQWLARGRPADRAAGAAGGADRHDGRGLVRVLVRDPAGPLADPRRWAVLLSWAALGIGMEAAALAAALHGVGGQVPLLATVTIYAALHLLWTVVPATGAPVAADVALLLALSALGAPLAAACAAVLVFRVLVFWAPALLGSALTTRLEHRLFL